MLTRICRDEWPDIKMASVMFTDKGLDQWCSNIREAQVRATA
jgi:hypothetical protein